MAVILAQKIMLTSQDGKLVRAVLCSLVQRHQGNPMWEESGEIPIIDDGQSVAFPAPGEMWRDENDARHALKEGGYHGRTS